MAGAFPAYINMEVGYGKDITVDPLFRNGPMIRCRPETYHLLLSRRPTTTTPASISLMYLLSLQ
jgi:hypothetical protein